MYECLLANFIGLRSNDVIQPITNFGFQVLQKQDLSSNDHSAKSNSDPSEKDLASVKPISFTFVWQTNQIGKNKKCENLHF